jgi:hypothetical protein
MEEMFMYAQSLGMNMGQPLPPGLFPTPYAPATTPVSLPSLPLALYLTCLLLCLYDLTHAISLLTMFIALLV